MVVTGGPGTGRSTTIVRAVLEIFLAKSLRVMLCASQTGRAAKRLTESHRPRGENDPPAAGV